MFWRNGMVRAAKSAFDISRRDINPIKFNYFHRSLTTTAYNLVVNATGFPFSVYMEYAGEDTSAASDVDLGNSAIMHVIHLPVLPFDLGLSYEYAELHTGWYTNGNYGDGM